MKKEERERSPDLAPSLLGLLSIGIRNPALIGRRGRGTRLGRNGLHRRGSGAPLLRHLLIRFGLPDRIRPPNSLHNTHPATRRSPNTLDHRPTSAHSAGTSPKRINNKKRETHLEHKPVSGRLEQRAELGLGPLLRVQQRQHDNIHAAHDAVVPGGLVARLAQAVVVDQDAGAGLEGGNKVLEEADGVGGGVVVHDPAEVVDCGWLLASEEIKKEGWW